MHARTVVLHPDVHDAIDPLHRRVVVGVVELDEIDVLVKDVGDGGGVAWEVNIKLMVVSFEKRLEGSSDGRKKAWGSSNGRKKTWGSSSGRKKTWGSPDGKKKAWGSSDGR